MQITDKIRQQLGTWTDLFVPFIETSAWDKIFTDLKMQVQARRTIVPKSANIFKSFELCDRNKMKAIIVLMDPYPSFTKDGEMIANGIPMDCGNTGKLQPTLELFHQGIEDCYFGFSPDYDKRVDISYLLKEENVLLLNSSLTCERDKPGSHSQLWLPFMKFLIEEILNKYYRGIPIVLCGAQAQKLEKYIQPMLHHILHVEHPVAANYQNRMWRHENMFKWINNILISNNGDAYGIQWHRSKTYTNELPQWVTENKNLKSAEDLGLPWKD
jgi:uracil-DNA glycosylase